MTKKNLLLCFLLITTLWRVSGQTETKPIDFTEYGGKLGVGVSILDGFGIPVRYYYKSNVFDAGLYMGGIGILDQDGVIKEFIYKPMLGAGYTFMGNKFLKHKRKRDKVRSNGVCMRLNYLTGDYQTVLPSLSWAQESFRIGRTNRSFIFELGIQYAFPNFELENGDTPASGVGIRLRCHWNFFLK